MKISNMIIFKWSSITKIIYNIKVKIQLSILFKNTFFYLIHCKLTADFFYTKSIFIIKEMDFK